MWTIIWKWIFRILKTAAVLVAGRAVVAIINLFGLFPAQAIANLVYSMIEAPPPGAIDAFQWSLAAIIGLSTWWLIHWYMGRRPNQINVELTPSTGPSPDIRLAVRNLGPTAKFSATCRVLASRNDPNELTAGVFNLQWKSANNRQLKLSKSEAQELVIARWQMWQDQGLCQIDILEWSNSGPQEFSGTRWNLGSEEKPLPEFDLEISIFEEGAGKPRRAKYILRPVKQFGPLEMVPLKLEVTLSLRD